MQESRQVHDDGEKPAMIGRASEVAGRTPAREHRR